MLEHSTRTEEVERSRGIDKEVELENSEEDKDKDNEVLEDTVARDDCSKGEKEVQQRMDDRKTEEFDSRPPPV